MGGLGAGEGEVPTAGEVGFGGADAEPLFGDLPGVVGDPGGAAFAGGGQGLEDHRRPSATAAPKDERVP